MTDETHVSSDEEDVAQPTAAVQAAIARKNRLLAMKSKVNGVEMKESDYETEEKPTKKRKLGEAGFRSYQPITEVLGKPETGPNLTVVEDVIQDHLKDTKDTTAVDSVDLSILAPKKVDWDLKRDLEKKLQKLERRTQRSIAEIIRERLSEGKGDLASAVNTAALQ